MVLALLLQAIEQGLVLLGLTAVDRQLLFSRPLHDQPLTLLLDLLLLNKGEEYQFSLFELDEGEMLDVAFLFEVLGLALQGHQLRAFVLEGLALIY